MGYETTSVSMENHPPPQADFAASTVATPRVDKVGTPG